jgi:hypothetical protein
VGVNLPARRARGKPEAPCRQTTSWRCAGLQSAAARVRWSVEGLAAPAGAGSLKAGLPMRPVVRQRWNTGSVDRRVAEMRPMVMRIASCGAKL